MSKMSKIDQMHLRAVMLCMSKTSKMGKEHTDTFMCILKHVEDVEDRSNAPKGCNAMYVEDGKRTCQRQTHFAQHHLHFRHL